MQDNCFRGSTFESEHAKRAILGDPETKPETTTRVEWWIQHYVTPMGGEEKVWSDMPLEYYHSEENGLAALSMHDPDKGHRLIKRTITEEVVG